MTNSTVTPINLVMPSTNELEQARKKLVNIKEKAEFAFRLSSKPCAIFSNYFYKVFRNWYDFEGLQLSGDMVIVSCTPQDLPSMIEILKTVIAEANQIAAPIIRAQAASQKIIRKREAEFYQLTQEHMKPVSIPNGRDYFTWKQMLTEKQAKDRAELDRKLAIEAFDEAVLRIVDLEMQGQHRVINA